MADKGRLLKLTDDVQEKIVEAVAAGTPLRFAADIAGVGERSVTRWLADGRSKKNKSCVAFLAAVKKAESDRVNSCCKKITTDQSWQAHAWWLERRFPDYFGSDSRVVKELKSLILEMTKGGSASDTPKTAKKSKTGHGRAIDPGD